MSRWLLCVALLLVVSTALVSWPQQSEPNGTTGLRVKANKHKVTVSWAPPTSNWTSFNLYRAIGTATTYHKIVNTTFSSYVDTNVFMGRRYCYEVTTLDVHAGVQESVKTLPACTVVP